MHSGDEYLPGGGSGSVLPAEMEEVWESRHKGGTRKAREPGRRVSVLKKKLPQHGGFA